MSKKPIIVFEGIEGSGKTLHIQNVAKYLKKKRKIYIKKNEKCRMLQLFVNI